VVAQAQNHQDHGKGHKCLQYKAEETLRFHIRTGNR
jgi:hypothetical protein